VGAVSYIVFENLKIEILFFGFLANPNMFRCPPFTLLPTAQFFVYLLYIDLSLCLEGHLDPELIQVAFWINWPKFQKIQKIQKIWLEIWQKYHRA
jgi:hypothetical protein